VTGVVLHRGAAGSGVYAVGDGADGLGHALVELPTGWTVAGASLGIGNLTGSAIAGL